MVSCTLPVAYPFESELMLALLLAFALFLFLEIGVGDVVPHVAETGQRE